MAHLVAEDGLVADEGAVGVAACVEDSALLAGFEGADLVEEIFGEKEEVFERAALEGGTYVF